MISYASQENCYICGKKFNEEDADDKIYCKIRHHCHYKTNTEVLHIE